MNSPLKWQCEICREERPDEFIDVVTKKVSLGRAELSRNIKYCRDKLTCKLSAERLLRKFTVHSFKLSDD